MANNTFGFIALVQHLENKYLPYEDKKLEPFESVVVIDVFVVVVVFIIILIGAYLVRQMRSHPMLADYHTLG